MTNLKGQGATEYLVLFAVVLIIAMVVIALLGFFPSIGTGAKQSASDSYWQSARPMQVSSPYIASNGHFNVRVQNSESGSIQITAVRVSTSLANDNSVTAAYSPALTLGTGESTNLTIASFIPSAGRCTNGTTYEYYVSFGYTQGGNAFSFNGTKPVIGKCA